MRENESILPLNLAIRRLLTRRLPLLSLPHCPHPISFRLRSCRVELCQLSPWRLQIVVAESPCPPAVAIVASPRSIPVKSERQIGFLTIRASRCALRLNNAKAPRPAVGRGVRYRTASVTASATMRANQLKARRARRCEFSSHSAAATEASTSAVELHSAETPLAAAPQHLTAYCSQRKRAVGRRTTAPLSPHQ